MAQNNPSRASSAAQAPATPLPASQPPAPEAVPAPEVEPAFPEADALSFEDALKQLEGIVSRLERGDVPLEESITMYERGEALKQRCESLLRQAEERVEKIRLKDGKPVGTEPFGA